MRLAPTATVVAVLVLAAAPALARDPPIVLDPREGIWAGAGEAFVHQARDRWSVYPAGAAVNRLAVDDLVIWIATDDGVIRFDSGSRKSSRLTMDDGLPSQRVTAVAVDDQYVWFGTNKGLARYRKLDRTIRVYTEEHGLPHRAVNDALTVGRQVWFATRAGIAYYDPSVDGLRALTAADGLAGEDVAELYQVGDDLWCRTDQGLSRLRIKTRAFSNFTFADIGGQEIRVFALDGDRVWIGTENGLVSFESQSDALVPFPQQAALRGRAVVGVEPFGDYLFIVTDQEVVQFHKLNRSIRHFTEAEGLAWREGVTGTLLSGGLLTLMYPDGALVYDIQRELWSSRTLAVEAPRERTAAVRFFGKVNADVPYDLHSRTLDPERVATAEAGFGLGLRFGGGRSLDAMARLDYGQLELRGIRDLEFRLEYLGRPDDVLREVRAGDKFQYRTLEEGLERPLMLIGGEARIASKGAEPKVSLTTSGGLRRGAAVRDFITGPRQEIYELSQRYILPGSERVYVDGELLQSGTDYTIIYPAGQLAFLDPERVDELSIIEVEYEHDLQPKKGLGALSLLDMLPADREVGDWTRAGEARLIREESGLYQQIDGAAPKYIDRGWVRSVYVEYRQGSRSIQVAIHDMGTEANAESLYDYDLPPAREAVPDHDNIVIDLGLATSYAAKAHTESFYIELAIDEKSDAAKQSLKLFAIQILERGENAGANPGGEVREWLAAARLASSPVHGLEVGARAIEVYGFGGPPDATRRRLLTGVLDSRYERAVGAGGRLTAYGELAGTDGQNPGDPRGWAGMGLLRLAHPRLEGVLRARHQSPGFTPIGSDATIFGTLRDEVRFSATGYPTRFLPLTGFFLRQLSTIETGGTGLVQQALGRVQLTREDAPATSLQFGHTLLDSPDATTGRIKAVGQADYDLARLLWFTGIKRFPVRAFYGLSQAETDEGGSFAHGDRVQLLRLEGKLAPTATESAYALFRQRKVWRQDEEGGNFGLDLEHWELNSGARSAIVPGLIPQANYAVIYDDDRVTDVVPVRSAKSALAGVLGIYPGQWWAPLAAVVIEPRYSLANDEAAADEIKTLFHRTHRIDNRAIYAGTGKLELELLQLWEVSLTGEDQHEDARKLELRNRIIYRPRFYSPVTVRLNYVDQRTLNDRSTLPTAPAWGRQSVSEGILEWLMRWNRVVTTKLKASYSQGRTRDLLFYDPASPPALVQTYTQHRVGGETELRLFPLKEASQLYLLQRNGVFRLFGDGAGAADTVDFYVSGGAIYTLGDRIYLDSEVIFRKVTCLAQPCTPIEPVTVRLYLTWNL